MPRRSFEMPLHQSNHNPTIAPHYTPDHPDPAWGPNPFHQQLRRPIGVTDNRPVLTKVAREPHLKPEYNKLYGTPSTEGSWRYIVDNFAVGTLTTIANTAVATAINLTLPPNWRLEQWPGAVVLFLVLRKFSMAPQSAIGTVGAIDVIYQDLIGGQQIPLGDFVSSSNINEDLNVIIPTPITDPGVTSVGSLKVTLNGTAPTVSIYNFQIAFSGAYLIPSLRGYEQERTREVLSDVHQSLADMHHTLKQTHETLKEKPGFEHIAGGSYKKSS